MPPFWAILTLVSALLLEAELGISAVAARPAPLTALHPRILHIASVPVRSPVIVWLGRQVNTSSLRVSIEPASPVLVVPLADRIALLPEAEWQPAQTYRVSLTPGSGFDRRLLPARWTADFQTQPPISVSGFRVEGAPVAESALIGFQDSVEIAFPEPMQGESVSVFVGAKQLDPRSVRWSADLTGLSFRPPGLVPYSETTVEVARGARTTSGAQLTEGGSLRLLPVTGLPSNPGSGIAAGQQHQTPIEVVIDNAPPARPQTGLQQADIVYEYLSEYQVSRMTAIFLGAIPGLIGPIRSCRMVNPYLGFAYQGLTMCSGASVGTLHYMFGNPEGGPLVPGSINDFDVGNHFFRSGGRPAPHNVFTTSDVAGRLRGEVPLAPGQFQVEPAHPDAEMGGAEATPDVPLHSVSYSYDPGSKTYARFDHGQPFIDGASGGQLRAKNVILLHVPYKDAGWIEDENGGAHSIWYDLLGSGPAQLYSNGSMIDVTWHMGNAPGQLYYDNHTPVWFSDASGQILQLNSGLTWIHILGNGQTG